MRIQLDHSQIKTLKSQMDVQLQGGDPYRFDIVDLTLPASPLEKLAEAVIKLVPATLMLAFGVTIVGLPIAYLLKRYIIEVPMFEKQVLLTHDKLLEKLGFAEYNKIFPGRAEAPQEGMTEIPQSMSPEAKERHREELLQERFRQNEKFEYQKELTDAELTGIDLPQRPHEI